MSLRNLSALTVFALAAGVSAQTIKPGLWEISNNVQSGGQDLTAAVVAMQKQMAAMPPEQRKMMQDMMAKQGMQMGNGGAGGMSIRICLTQDMVEHNEVAPKQQGDCTHTTSPRVGSTLKYAFKCSKPASSGQGEVTFTSPEAYSMKMSMTTAERNMEMQATGKWLGTQCGDIKPTLVPTAK